MYASKPIPFVLAFKKIHPRAQIPAYGHSMDAGMDVTTIEDIQFVPNEVELVRTGLVMEFQDEAGRVEPLQTSLFHAGTTLEIQVRSRGGVSVKTGLMVVNSPGTVDFGYRGEIMLPMRWFPLKYSAESNPLPGFELDGTCILSVSAGVRIAQLIVAEVRVPKGIIGVDLVGETERGEGRLNSTGSK